ncbi:MAG: hypothetical protein AABY16_04435 [Nanoarchaeota archaeon]
MNIMNIFNHRKLAISLIILLLIIAYFYLQPGFYFGQTVRDTDRNFEKLIKSFVSQVSSQHLESYGSYSYSYSYQHKDGSWEIIQPEEEGIPWYANFIDTNGNRTDKFLNFRIIWTNTDEMYFRKPYLFLTSHPGFLHIYNIKTHQLRTIDPRSSGCNDEGSHLTGVAYDDGILYTEQSKQWSLCAGSFKRRLNLDF